MDSATIWPTGQWLNPNDTITSNNRQFQLVMQDDGNLVIYSVAGTRTPVWASNTVGNPGAKAVFQGDGNIVVYASDGVRPLWASNSSGHAAQSAQLTDEGTLVVGEASAPVWASGSLADKAANAAAAAKETAEHAADAVKGLFSKLTGH